MNIIKASVSDQQKLAEMNDIDGASIFASKGSGLLNSDSKIFANRER